MLIKILKLVGLDVPGRIAAARLKLDERVELAKYHVKEAAQTAAIVTVLFALAVLAILVALGIGFVALYWWVALAYGQFYGLAAVAGLLTIVAIGLFVIAMAVMRTKSSDVATRATENRLRRAMEEAQAKTVAAPATAVSTNAALQPPAPVAASDLVEPLSLILSKLIRLPTTGNVVLDEVFVPLRAAARGAADEAMECVANTIRYGDRSKLLAILGVSFLTGWWLGRHGSKHVP
jgi:hypothetical protein